MKVCRLGHLINLHWPGSYCTHIVQVKYGANLFCNSRLRYMTAIEEAAYMLGGAEAFAQVFTVGLPGSMRKD